MENEFQFLKGLQSIGNEFIFFSSFYVSKIIFHFFKLYTILHSMQYLSIIKINDYINRS